MLQRNLALIFLASILWLSSCQTASEEQRERLPNVLLVITDDQGYGDVAVHGNDSIQTPVQDRLAQEGIRLDNFYVSPVCAPTRASLLTGRYHYRTGTTWVTRNGEAMRSEELTLAEVFKANGYATACFGKWHNGGHFPQNPNGQGFTEFTGFCGGHWNRYNDPDLEHNGRMYRAKGYITDILTDSTLAFIQRHQDEPFFAYVPFNTPHTPYIAPKELFEKYKRKGLSDRIASTYGMVESIDNNLGRLLEGLEKAGIEEETLVIFITDNGPNYDRYNQQMKGRKGWVNDGGVRVPSFWYWKGKWPGGQVRKELTAHIDVLPSLIELLGLEKPAGKPLDGISFATLFEEPSSPLPSRQFFTFATELNAYKGAIRTPEYRLTVNGKENYELTHLLDDPGEQNDLRSSMPRLADSLYQTYLAKYKEVTQEVEDFLPIPVGYAEAPLVRLFAHEGFPSGGASYQASKWGWCNDWFVNWKEPTDTLSWNIDLVESGRFKVSVEYNCTADQLGPVIHITAGASETQASLTQAFEGSIIPNADQVPRKVEADDRSWGTAPIGEMTLEKGRQQLRVFATRTKDLEVAALKSVILERQDE